LRKIIYVSLLILLVLPVLAGADTLKIKGELVKLRAEPSREARVLAYAGEGKEFEVVKSLPGGWYAVRLPNKMLAWVQRGDDIEAPGARVAVKASGEKKKSAETAKADQAALKSAGEKPAKQTVAAKKGKKQIAAPPPVKKPGEGTTADKPQAAVGKAGGGKTPAPRFISTPEIEKAGTLISKSYYLAIINLIFGIVCLLLARRKKRSILAWFTLGIYFIIISLIVILIKRKREGPSATKLAVKIVSVVFLVIWFGAIGALYLFSQNTLRDHQAVQDKVYAYLLQTQMGNYKDAYLSVSPQGRQQMPYKKFVTMNENIHGAMGYLKHYRLKELNIRYLDSPTIVVYTGKFERGPGTITFTMKKEGGIESILKGGDWKIISIRTQSPKLHEKKQEQEKRAS